MKEHFRRNAQQYRLLALLAILLGWLVDLLQKKVTPRGMRKEGGK